MSWITQLNELHSISAKTPTRRARPLHLPPALNRNRRISLGDRWESESWAWYRALSADRSGKLGSPRIPIVGIAAGVAGGEGVA